MWHSEIDLWYSLAVLFLKVEPKWNKTAVQKVTTSKFELKWMDFAKDLGRKCHTASSSTLGSLLGAFLEKHSQKIIQNFNSEFLEPYWFLDWSDYAWIPAFTSWSTKSMCNRMVFEDPTKSSLPLGRKHTIAPIRQKKNVPIITTHSINPYICFVITIRDNKMFSRLRSWITCLWL